MNFNVRLSFSIVTAKIIMKLCRVFHFGGTSFPGKIARRIYPNIIQEISRDIKIIMITGTNGKTTTTKIINQILVEAGISFITNKSGSNLFGGIISTFIEDTDYLGKSKKSHALIEIDEAAFNLVTNYIKPDILVVTNFFRDQLDRYGELYTTLNGVFEGIKKCDTLKLILNADDSLCVSLNKDHTDEVFYFGLSDILINNTEQIVNADASYCIYCKHKYDYTHRTYGHLGHFICNNCGYERPEANITCTSVLDESDEASRIKFTIDNKLADEEVCEYEAKINLPGLYNVYNSLAAISLGVMLDINIKSIINALMNFECSFGRMETINVGNGTIKIILVKNPTGFNQVISYLINKAAQCDIVFIINDNLADGTDISWLWDVDFEKLVEIEDSLNNTYTCGTRGEDLAVRLKYSGIQTKKIEIEDNFNILLQKTILNPIKNNENTKYNLFILPTYTAMLKIRKILQQKFNLKEFWE